jgi:hypothetical protein
MQEPSPITVSNHVPNHCHNIENKWYKFREERLKEIAMESPITWGFPTNSNGVRRRFTIGWTNLFISYFPNFAIS